MSGPVAMWRRLDLPGHDACRLVPIEDGWRLEGVAVFRHAEGPASLRYRVDCDAAWRSRRGRVEGFVSEREVRVAIERVGTRWCIDGDEVGGLSRCEDLDFGFTPATNLLQIRRAAMAVGARVEVPVAWYDVDAGVGGLSELQQWYERRSAERYWYEAPRFGFEGMLVIGPDGFARAYPPLWEAVP
ncbi:MAG TPA: putative glycolipid-binding domain-containing protein [Gemmatimonadaceae bacterium]|nr:putative glycolipid-binding domain-containing protein [Gemmatimonadaceae bacterium]